MEKLIDQDVGATSSRDPAESVFQILTFDGGGLKGLFAAALLAEVERQLNVSLANHFDLIAGTSTGGLIALGLGADMSPAEIVDFYVAEGPRIFGTPRRIGRLWHSKHDPAGLRSALRKVFGDRSLGSSSKRLVVPAYSLDLNDVYLFKTRHDVRFTRDHTESFVDVAMACCAAPTYLPAFPLRNQRIVDGGVWANNPALVALAEAIGVLHVPLSHVRIVSMGTTDEVISLGSGLDSGGLIQWGRRAAGTLLRAQALGSLRAVEQLIGSSNIVRVDQRVAADVFHLDRLDVRRIRGLAEAHAGHVCQALKAFTSHTAAPFTPFP